MSMAGSPADVAGRIERLPASRPLFWVIGLIALGGFFEHYDLFMTAYVSPGLIRAGVFQGAHKGLFGLTDQAGFAAATFLGLFIGALLFSQVADRFGRRTIFTASLLWYSAATLVMAGQSTALGVDLWRLIAGIGIGVELVTIDAYVVELTPAVLRGRAMAFTQLIQFTAVPTVALVSWLLVERAPFGVAGWRWVMVLAGLAAVAVWAIRARLPESPRWLAAHGRAAEADAVLRALEARIAARAGPLPPPAGAPAGEAPQGRFGEIFRPPYLGLLVLMSVFNFAQTIGFYGFGNWVPSLIAGQGHGLTKSLAWSFIIACAFPLGPLVFGAFTDRIERKWQIVAAAIGTATLGLVFAGQSAPVALIACGVGITLCNTLLSFAYHTYQAELFPTRIRARAVGFVYSWSRLSTVLTSFMIAFVLQEAGTRGVFVFIAAAMGVVVVAIGVFGPRTRDRALEEITSSPPAQRRGRG
jgi:putative MFS transporter